MAWMSSQPSKSLGASPPVAMMSGQKPSVGGVVLDELLDHAADAVVDAVADRFLGGRCRSAPSAPRASTRGSLAVRSCSASSCMPTPGAIAPPRNSPASLQKSTVMAVPASTTTQRLPHLLERGRDVEHAIDARLLGLSVRTGMGRSSCRPTHCTAAPATCSTACSIGSTSGGLTLAPATAGASLPLTC